MSDWCLSPSEHSSQTINPALNLIQSIQVPDDFTKPVYSLAMGDPSAYPDFSVYPFVLESVSSKLLESQGNGYTDSQGLHQAREALAQEYSYENIKLKSDDVIIDIGGVGAIHTVLQVFLNPGDNILIPSPGFCLYQTMAWNLRAEAFLYDLDPKNAWQVNFDSLNAKVNERTKLLVIVNPSNPCGSVFSKEHLQDIVRWAEEHRIPILADEVYHGMTFGKPHIPLGSVAAGVPVFTVGALSKMFLVPGWRCGWIIIYDRENRCRGIRDSIRKVKNMLLHPPPFIMQAIPDIFRKKPANYYEDLMSKVKLRADLVKHHIQSIPGLYLSESEGSLYTMISIDLSMFPFKDSASFCKSFAHKQGVILLPAEAFLSRSGFRVVLCTSLEILSECMLRLKSFVEDLLSPSLPNP